MNKRIHNTIIHVIKGDLTKYQVDNMHLTDALIVAIDAKGEGHDTLNGIIRTISNDKYHTFLRARLEFNDFEVKEFETFLAPGPHNHYQCFRHVIFVIDEKEPSPEQVVYHGLTFANKEHMHAVAMPFFGAELLRNADEARMMKAINAIVSGLEEFFKIHKTTSIEHISFVFSSDTPVLQELFEKALNDV